MASEVAVRVVIPHSDLDYHEWINLRGARVRANRLGINNRRMYIPLWQRWTCNNTACPALAFVSEVGIRDLIARAETQPGGRLWLS